MRRTGIFTVTVAFAAIASAAVAQDQSANVVAAFEAVCIPAGAGEDFETLAAKAGFVPLADPQAQVPAKSTSVWRSAGEPFVFVKSPATQTTSIEIPFSCVAYTLADVATLQNLASEAMSSRHPQFVAAKMASGGDALVYSHPLPNLALAETMNIMVAPMGGAANSSRGGALSLMHLKVR